MKVKSCLAATTIFASIAGGVFSVPAPAFAAKTELVLGAAAADIGSLDPHFANNTSDRTVVGWIFGGLVRFAPGSANPETIEPDLAERWESSEDKLSWTFHLRQGVQWQAGYGDVTADDVVFSLNKTKDPKRSAFSGDYTAFKTIEAIDPHTVKITLSRQVPSLLGLLTNYAGGFIISKKAYEERGEDFKRNPVGFGPFSVQSVTPGQAVTLVANETYFRGKPQITKVTYRFLPNNAARDLAFDAGELDAEAGVQDQQWVQRITRNPAVIVDAFQPVELALLHINVTKPPFNDIRVRRALAYAVDVPGIVKFIGPVVGQAPQSVIPSSNLGFTENAGVLKHDPAKAKALLKEAGFPDGLSVTMIASQLPGMASVMQVIQAQVAESGITLNLQPVEHASWHQMIRKDLSPIVYYGAARFPVADYYLTQFYHSASAIGQPGQVTNFSHCSVADKQIEAARTETDTSKQIELWQEAQKLIVSNVCAIPIIETRTVWAHRNTVDWGYKFEGSMSLGPQITEKTRIKGQ
ncbi:ABC transporter substrate-binding protein [Rhizobium paknamense]|uniref:Peptide/nickel transport system substrate-binding protein n=1 Tax=Rhizobium paknamense TaxID=1206817 RepID=A0ABU0IDI9_9HYPH|nr:ABC transporter substrate-binding protein [Rhizobium paknamense]MDQ0456317.1 peptide/nickel transport system substrate-binding protein [Rhizobium paknamense]